MAEKVKITHKEASSLRDPNFFIIKRVQTVSALFFAQNKDKNFVDFAKCEEQGKYTIIEQITCTEEPMDRISKENYYLDIAQTVLERATCLRRVYGAIIVRMTRSFPPATTAHPAAARTAWIWATAPVRR